MTGTGKKDVEGIAILEPKTRQKLKRPEMWKVVFHNDDYTPMEFVVLLLMTIFQRTENEATAIMLLAHRTGKAIAGVYPRDVAETKMAESQKAAEEFEYPLLVTLEPDDLGGDEEKT